MYLSYMISGHIIEDKQIGETGNDNEYVNKT